MRTSESIDQICAALVEFQTMVKDASKDAQGYNYRYATLPHLLALIRPDASACGLAHAQTANGDAVNVGVTTRLMHTSGQWIEDDLSMGVTVGRGMSAAQAAGSVISYCRRYSLLTIYGISQADDDAEVEDAEITPATDDQYAAINDYVQAGQVPKRRLAWLQNEKNWNNLTKEQADLILGELRSIK